MLQVTIILDAPLDATTTPPEDAPTGLPHVYHMDISTASLTFSGTLSLRRTLILATTKGGLCNDKYCSCVHCCVYVEFLWRGYTTHCCLCDVDGEVAGPTKMPCELGVVLAKANASSLWGRQGVQLCTVMVPVETEFVLAVLISPTGRCSPCNTRVCVLELKTVIALLGMRLKETLRK